MSLLIFVQFLKLSQKSSDRLFGVRVNWVEVIHLRPANHGQSERKEGNK